MDLKITNLSSKAFIEVSFAIYDKIDYLIEHNELELAEEILNLYEESIVLSSKSLRDKLEAVKK